MSTIPFTQFGELHPGDAERWIAAALANAAALHGYDAWLYPNDAAKLPAAERLHEAWRMWVDDSQTLLREAEVVAKKGYQVPQLDTLRNNIGQIRSMLRMTPELILQRHAQMKRGEVYPAEEVRRELRSGHRG